MTDTFHRAPRTADECPTDRLWCPIAIPPHPYLDRVETDAIAWLYHYGLGDEGQRRRLSRMRVGEVARMPESHYSLEGTQLLADMSMFILTLDNVLDSDDLQEDPGRRLARTVILAGDLHDVLARPLGKVEPDEPYAAALHNLLTRMSELGSTEQMQRFATSLDTYLSGGIRQQSFQMSSRPCDVATALALRLHANGARPFPPLHEIVGGYHVPADDLAAPQVVALTEMTHMLLGWDNDIISWPKEARHNEDHANIITLLARANGSDEARAVAEVVMLCNRVMALFLEVGHSVMDRSAALRFYVEDLFLIVAAYLRWCLLSGYYDESVADRYSRLVEPIHTITEPLAIDPGRTPPIPELAQFGWWDSRAESSGVSSAPTESRAHG